jgi:hypothetical protein
MLIILAILTVHFVADFVFQSSQMATNKSKSIKWLSIHVGVYGLVSLLSAFIICFKFDNCLLAFGWWSTNVLLHFIVDFFTSKVTSKLWEQKKTRLFFTMIGFDQLLHNICLIGTYYYFLEHQLILRP